MKKLKRLLVIGLVVTMIMPANALVVEKEIQDMTIVTSEEDFNKYTIDFSNEKDKVLLQAMTTNADKVESARSFVCSLGLDKMGFEEIQDACLSNLATLDEELNEKNATLRTYSVLVPKSNSYTFYGSYGSRNFYYSFYDEYTYDIEKNADYNIEMIRAWVSGAISAVLLFPGESVGWTTATVGWTAFSSAMGIPKLYEVNYNAHVEHYAIVDVTSRGIYWKSGNSTYELVYKDEKAIVSPYLLLYTLDSSLDNPVPAYRCARQSIYSDNYFDSEYILDTANYAAGRGMQFRDPIYIQNHTELEWK